MSWKNSILGFSEPENVEFLDIFILMNVKNFMLSIEATACLLTDIYFFSTKSSLNLLMTTPFTLTESESRFINVCICKKQKLHLMPSTTYKKMKE